jgi:hypothetical protein
MVSATPPRAACARREDQDGQDHAQEAAVEGHAALPKRRDLQRVLEEVRGLLEKT